jgi:AbrB family looped-hinge helix DNA binding protein
MDKARISSRWQVVIPKNVRKSMGLEIGGALAFKVEGDRAVVYPLERDPVKALRGRYKGKNYLEELMAERRRDLQREERGLKKPKHPGRGGG